ncbi:MAG: molybdenum cofactor guanylyltransferase [Actinomycetes bacterium]
MSEVAASVAGAVIGGGQGTRMDTTDPKPMLSLGDASFGGRAAWTLSRAIGGGPVFYSTAPGVEAPLDLPEGVQTVVDPAEDSGPLTGLLEGLLRARGETDLLLVIPCDMPLLHPTLLRRLIERSEQGGISFIPTEDGSTSPFPSVWSTRLADDLLNLHLRGERSPRAAMSELGAVAVARDVLSSDAEMMLVDPELVSLLDVNDQSALEVAEANRPRVRTRVGDRRGTAREWNLGGLATALGVADAAGMNWVINGRPIAWNAATPLFERDAVSLN